MGGCGRQWDPLAARPRSIVMKKTDVRDESSSTSLTSDCIHKWGMRGRVARARSIMK